MSLTEAITAVAAEGKLIEDALAAARARIKELESAIPQPPAPAPATEWVAPAGTFMEFSPTSIKQWRVFNAIGDGNFVREENHPIMGRAIRAHAVASPNASDTSKACLEQTFGRSLTEGSYSLSRVEYYIDSDGSLRGLYFDDKESADSRSAGPRLKCNADGTIRLDAGKLENTKGYNDDDGRNVIALPKKKKFVLEIETKHSKTRAGYIICRVDGREAYRHDGITLGPDIAKWQILITALGLDAEVASLDMLVGRASLYYYNK